MQPLILTATTAVSGIGCGMAATLQALRARCSGLRPCTFGDVSDGYIGCVDAVTGHRLPWALRHFECRNNRLADLALRTDGFADAVALARQRYGADRIAVILGTSTSGIQSAEDAYRARDPLTGALPLDFDYAHTQDMFSLAQVVRSAFDLQGPAIVVSTACASSARTFIDAVQMSASAMCDAAIV